MKFSLQKANTECNFFLFRCVFVHAVDILFCYYSIVLCVNQILFHNYFLLLQLIGQANICYASELSQVNPQMRHMELKTRNVRSYLTVLLHSYHNN